MTPLIRVVTIAVLPIAVLISISHLAGAEQGPGDGFTAGIISALGFALQYVLFGYAEARRMFSRIRFRGILAAGLGVAVFASVMPILAGLPAFAIQEWDIDLSLLGTVRLSRAMIFDVGIYLVVLGGSMTVVDSLGRAMK